MDHLIEFFSNIFETALWPPRWHCGTWSSFHGWLYIISNLLIWLAYFSIPASLIFILNKKSFPFKNLINLFILFILSCGATHLIDALIFWVPIYRVNALMLLLTAVVSIITAITLLKAMPRLLSFKSPEELEREIEYRKKAENEVRKLNIELEDRVNRRTAELESLNKELQSFTYRVSHDLRSPVLSILALSDLLKSEKLGEESKLINEKIEQSASHLSKLLNDLLELSKSSNKPISKVSIDLTHLIRSIQEELLFNKTIDDSVIININTPHTIYGDPTLMTQVFFNLINNACKYSKGDTNTNVHIKTEDEGEYILISIRDNGIGFDMKYHDEIFGVFTRLKGSKKEKGSGIGLSLVKKVIEKHDGKVWAESEVDVGSTFYIRLPKAN